ncbi:MAG: hypothetical protein AB9922_07490 [Bacteroidales bacterium]
MYKGQEDSLFDAGRILSVKKLTSLAEAFESTYPFSVYARPHTMISVDVVISATPAEDPSPVDVPLECNAWSTVLLRKIEANATLLTENDVYIGFGIKTK